MDRDELLHEIEKHFADITNLGEFLALVLAKSDSEFTEEDLVEGLVG